MVKKYSDDEKQIVSKPVKRKYARKENVKQLALDVKDFLPKLQKKNEAALKRDVMKIKEALESEYSQLKKKVSARKEAAKAEIATKSTETERKDAIKEEKKVEKDLKESQLRVADMTDALKSDVANRDKTLTAVMTYLQNMALAKKPATPRISRAAALKNPLIGGPASPIITATPVPQLALANAPMRTIKVPRKKNPAVPAVTQTGRSLPTTPTGRSLPAVPAKKKPVAALVVSSPESSSPDTSPTVSRIGSPTLGGAGFKKGKKTKGGDFLDFFPVLKFMSGGGFENKQNIALLGKEGQLKSGRVSIALSREMRQLDELKRNRAVVIPRRDLIDAERPINYELSIL